MTEYEQGQKDLIDHIKDKAADIATNSSSDDMPLDLINMLMSLEVGLHPVE